MYREDLFFVWDSREDLFFVWDSREDLFFVWESRDLFFVWDSREDLFFVWDSREDLFSVWESRDKRNHGKRLNEKEHLLGYQMNNLDKEMVHTKNIQQFKTRLDGVGWLCGAVFGSWPRHKLATFW